jgi:sugar lactone lactonase YvrE
MIKVVVLLLLCVVNVNAQALNDLYRESIQAYEGKDYTQFLRLNQKLDSIRPMHPGISYNLASAYMLNNDQANAFKILKRIALMDSKTSIESDSIFRPFLKTAYYTDLQKLRLVQDKITGISKKITTLTEKDLHPEGLVYLHGPDQWLAASVRKRKIAAFDSATGKCFDWLAGNDMLAVFSIKESKDGKYLWAATAAIPEMENYTAALNGKAEVLKIAIATQKIVERYPLEGNHVFGDISVTASGAVYVSDSGTAILYKIENGQMAEWLDLRNEAYNLQGLTADDNEEMLYVADYLKGILAIPIKNRAQKKWFDFPEGTTPKGIDGLAYYNNSLIAIHNGVSPIRILRYSLNKAKNAFAGYEVLDNNRPEFDEPTIGTLHNGTYYFFANAPWKAYDKNFSLNQGLFSNPELFALPLKK